MCTSHSEHPAAEPGGCRIVVTGKGGVGKTTITSCLARILARRRRNVLVADADPQMNLPHALGLSVEEASRIVPLNRNSDYIEEKAGARPGESWGAFLKLNPCVDDVVGRFGLRLEENLSLLVMGTVVQAATGCLCSENVLLDSVVRHLSLGRDEVVLLDTQAGVEHFGRSLSKGFSQCLVVTDATFNAFSVALHSAELARQVGIPHVGLVVNRAGPGSEERIALLAQWLGVDLGKAFNGVFLLPAEEQLVELEPNVTKVLDLNSAFSQTLESLVERLLAVEAEAA